MAVRHYTFNLTSTAIPLNLGTFDKHSSQTSTIIFNTDKQNNDVAMIGGAGVTNTNFGVHLDPDETVAFSNVYTGGVDGFYAVAKTTTAVLHVLVVD